MTALLKRTVVEVRGLHWATSKAVVERVLLQRPGVAAVDANPVAQTATVSFDPSVTSVEQISGWVRDCGYHCRGESVPAHVCYPMEESIRTSGMEHDTARKAGAGHRPSGHVHPGAAHPMEHVHPVEADHRGMHPGRAPERAEPRTGYTHPPADSHAGHGPDQHGGMPRTPQDMMGHGGHHAGMSMDDMVKRHAQPVPGGRGPVHRSDAVVPDRAGYARVHRTDAVRAA